MAQDSSRARIQLHQGDKVRIGPVSIITLIAVICMAVLAVLAASTSNATAAISERQANANQLLYLNESAGQEFVAGIDDALAGVRAQGGSATDGAQAVQRELDAICQQAREATDGRVDCTANVEDTTVTAEFVCENTRRLTVAVTIRDNATYRIDEWKTASAQQAPPSAGTLWQGA